VQSGVSASHVYRGLYSSRARSTQLGFRCDVKAIDRPPAVEDLSSIHSKVAVSDRFTVIAWGGPVILGQHKAASAW